MTLRVVDVAGSPSELGRAHGAALADEISSLLDRWCAHLEATGTLHPRRWVDSFVTSTGYEAAVRRHLPELAEEIDAIGVGAGITHAESWFLQLMDEVWQHRDRAGGEVAGGEVAGGLAGDAPGCTSFGVVTGMRSWSGQTMDLESFRDGSQAVLRLAAGDVTTAVVTMAGCVGLLGVSSRGVAVLVNALPQTPSATEGLPVAAVVRGVLAQQSIGDAEAWLRSAPHATGQHYLLASSACVVSLECSPAGVAQVMPGAQRLWHTNHPLVGYVPTEADAESDRRWESVREVIGRPGWGRVRSREILAQPPVHRPAPGDGGGTGAATATFAAATVEQALQGIELHVTTDAPSGEWTHLAVDRPDRQ